MAAPKVPSSHAYLLDAPTLTLATIAPDGRPQLSQIWFLAEDGVVKTGSTRCARRSRTSRPTLHVTVFILDTANPQKYLEIRGDGLARARSRLRVHRADVRQVRQPSDPRVGRP